MQRRIGHAALGLDLVAFGSIWRRQSLAASTEMSRREPTRMKRGPLPARHKLYKVALQMSWDAQNSSIEWACLVIAVSFRSKGRIPEYIHNQTIFKHYLCNSSQFFKHTSFA